MATGRQRKGEATRQALMDAGFKVFAEKGFLRAQISDIVREAGKSNGVFHIYFKNKDALLDAWMDECDRMVPWFHADTSLLFEKARRFILQSHWSLHARYGPILKALEAAALVSDPFRDRLGHLRRTADQGMARMIRNAQQEGRCRGIDPELTAISIGAMLSWSTTYWLSHRSALEARGIGESAAIDHLDMLCMRLLEPGAATASNADMAFGSGIADGHASAL